MIHQPYPPAATTESYFFFDNAAPQTGKRTYPNIAEEVPWRQRHLSGSKSFTSNCAERNTNDPYFVSAYSGTPTYEPIPKKARVVSDDEHEDPTTMSLHRMKRALQQLETEESLHVGRDTKRARMEVLLPVSGPPLPPEQETRLVLRDPSLPRIPHPMQEAEKAIFNSLLLQRISNRYGGVPIQLDHVDSRLQELIRSSMQRTITARSEDQTSNSSSMASCASSDDVTMEEDERQDSPESGASCYSSSFDESMMTF
ncbi:unnamed protein product [Cylindrotheca closterium]|uniref:Uncharacterized protein n=1 Tax=Cylindrotheca closterium TaxID=2856 RepID=A0AAD2FNT2_9STRA|nr:unnamed protein product [Cylindrotheca closterium]